MGCRKLAEHFSVEKTAISIILKGSKNLWRDYEFFKGCYKKRRYGEYLVIKETVGVVRKIHMWKRLSQQAIIINVKYSEIFVYDDFFFEKVQNTI